MDDVEAYLNQFLGLMPNALGHNAIRTAVNARMLALGVKEPKVYLATIVRSAAEMQVLTDALVNGETWFFREPQMLGPLVQTVREKLKKLHRPVRILTVACSTGEEPYTIAMALYDAGIPEGCFTIDAVDISSRSLATAKEGLYPRTSFRGSDQSFRERHFLPERHGWRVVPRVRSTVQFRMVNVLNGAATTRTNDLVTCRNLLIYLDAEARGQVFGAIAQALEKDGVMYVAAAEAATVPHDLFHSDGAGGFLKGARKRPAEVAAKAPPAPKRAPTPKPTRPAPPPKSEAAPAPVEAVVAAQALADQGKYEEAVALLKKCAPTDETFYLMGMVESARGNDDAAVEMLRRALYLNPRHEEARLLMSLSRARAR